jgi:nitrate reductase cytochrome c-type subunit
VPVAAIWSAIVASLATSHTEKETGRTDQTIKVSNPAKKNPPSSIDQSPESNPRSRPSAVKRSAVERKHRGCLFCHSTNVAIKHAKCLLAVADGQHGATTIILGHPPLPAISRT